MRVVIAGGRNIDITPPQIERICEQAAVAWYRDGRWGGGWPIREALVGDARGVDAAAAKAMRNILVPVRVFPANWLKYGRAAGPIRNAAMAAEADALILIWDGESRGSASMLSEAQRRGLHIYERLWGVRR